MEKKLSYEELEKKLLILEEAQSKYDAIFNAGPIIIGLSDIETGAFVEVNQTFYDKLGFTPDEVIGKKSKDVILLDETFRKENIEKLKKDGLLRNIETIIFNNKKEKLNVLFSAQVIELQNKKYNLVTAIDITKLKRFDELQKFQNTLAIELSSISTLEEILKKILTNIFRLDEFDSGGIYLVDGKTGNLNFQLFMGLSEKLAKTVKLLDSEDVRTQIIMEGDLIYLKTSEAPEQIKKALKIDNILSLIVVPIKFGGKIIGSINLASRSHEVVSDFSKDVLESISKMDVGGVIFRVITEDIIKKSEEKYRDIFDNLMDVYFKTSLNGIIEDVSPSVEIVSGYSVLELKGKKVDILYQNHKDREGLLAELMEKGQIRGFEILFQKKNGEIYNASINADLKYNKNGEPVSLTGTIRDITESKRSEKEKIRAQKIASDNEKLALVGRIAGKMAHDFNNVLAIIMGNAQLALLDSKEAETKNTLKKIFEQTLRGKNLTKNLIAFAKDQEPKQEFFRLNEKIDLVITLLKKDLEGIEIIKEEKSGFPELLADPGMIEHGFVNLIQNSIHALSMVKDPKIIIRTYKMDDNLCVEIEDNGCGIPQEHLENIFEPSFTLKGNKDVTQSYKSNIKGTGYGMANVRKYIQMHKGNILVESKSGSGTKFTIKIPIVEKELTIKEKTIIKEETAQFKKYILLVEDEQSLSDVQYRILTQGSCKHKVDIAINGQVAMDLFGRNKYDFVSLDYILPGNINGMDVYNYIRETDKNIPILFVSGNIEFLESIKELKQIDFNIDHVSKPCQNKDYVDSINKLLDHTLA